MLGIFYSGEREHKFDPNIDNEFKPRPYYFQDASFGRGWVGL